MKNYLKLSIFAISFFLFFVFGLSNIYADSQPMADYTYVDCENGSDTTGIPFDHSKPYLSLKQGIEKTILYINNNGLTNVYGTGGEYINFIFEIRVKGGCKYDGKDGNITLNFAGTNNSSTLSIVGAGGYPVIENVYFQLGSQQVGNIEFENFNFSKNDLTGYYFAGYKDSTRNTLNSGVIKVKKSLININTGKQFMYFDKSTCLAQESRRGVGRVCVKYSTINPGGFSIENSNINLRINGNYDFRAPFHLKDNKISIINSNTDNVKYNVNFYIAGKNQDGYNYGSITFISNEIDLGGNSFRTENSNSTYINDKFTNVGGFKVGTDDTNVKYNTFVNNQVQSTGAVIITNNEVAYNNLFLNGFTDTRDTDNYKNNYTGSIPTSAKGIGWILRKTIGTNINIDTDYRILYQEVTGEELPYVENPLFIVVY